MLFWIPSVLLGLAYLVALSVYRYGWFVAAKNALPYPATSVRISVIVPVRNEERNLTELLQSLLAQQYPLQNLEIILVDDGSDDNTLLLAQTAAEEHAHLKVVVLDPRKTGNGGKKRAIEAGIAAATGEWIVCTDADCTHHPQWLQYMAGACASGKKFAAAPVVFRTQSNMLSVFQTLDFMTLQGITAASVALRLHSMCNGANLAYRRDAFYDVEGFTGIDRLPTGDDMLLMHKIYRKYPDAITYIWHQHAMVQTYAPETWNAFFQQRIRWASKAAFFDDRRMVWVLWMVFLLNVWIMVLMVGAFFSQQMLCCLLTTVMIKLLAEFWFLWPVAGFFRKRQWLWWFPLLQPVHIMYTITAGWLGRFGSYVWKGRTILKPS